MDQRWFTDACALSWAVMLTRGRGVLVYKSKPIWDRGGAIQAEKGQLQALQKPLQNVQHRSPLAEDERMVPLFLCRRCEFNQRITTKSELCLHRRCWFGFQGSTKPEKIGQRYARKRVAGWIPVTAAAVMWSQVRVTG